VLCEAFLYLNFGFEIFWHKNTIKKAALKMLMKFTTDCNLLWYMDQNQVANMASWLGTAIRRMEDSMWTSNCRRVWRQQFGLD